MTREQVQEKIVSMMAQTFELDAGEIKGSSHLYEDLDLDSIDALDMMVKLQELMGRRVEEQQMRELRTVDDVVALVMRSRAETDRQVAG